MMRLPRFRYLAPRTVREAAAILAGEGPQAMVVAGGTDLYPNMKRRQQTPKSLIGLRLVEALRGVRGDPARGIRIGPRTTLSDLEQNVLLRRHYPGLIEAVHSVATPILRNMGTIGGNICLDTRCNYLDQTYEWRRAIDFCMKCDGTVCWVAPGSEICLAVSSSDTAPMLCALGARLRLGSKRGERKIAARDFYRRDGIRHLARRPDEILTEVELPPAGGWRSCYRKLRRREAFDFPVLGVAACGRFEGPLLAEASLWLGAVSMAPVEAREAQAFLTGRPLTDEAIEEAARLAYPVAKPVDNTDFGLRFRKEMTLSFVSQALRALRPPDLTASGRFA
ncbi:MAG TPA: FAD binding domain-containing protein [Candidatus Polarisedimenticolia bacterium]|nr:FAD binding domain-containing protein [Candidatus Polarisedimenticolia bacterium]